jgi:hypothetical protein
MKKMMVMAMLVALAIPAFADQNIPENISKVLKKHNPKVKWERMLGQADINCDGKQDYIAIGKAKNRLYVAVAIGPLSDKSKVSSINIGLGNEGYQDSLGETNPSVRIVSLDYDPKETTGLTVEGFKRSKTCKGVEIGGEETDEFNVYWNHKKDSLDWWRL